MQTFDEKEWAQVREGGKMPFLLRHGFLGRGLPLGVITSIAITAYNGSGFPEMLQSLEYYGMLVFCVAVFTTSGAIAANANWTVHERRHARSGE